MYATGDKISKNWTVKFNKQSKFSKFPWKNVERLKTTITKLLSDQ